MWYIEAKSPTPCWNKIEIDKNGRSPLPVYVVTLEYPVRVAFAMGREGNTVEGGRGLNLEAVGLSDDEPELRDVRERALPAAELAELGHLWGSKTQSLYSIL